MATKHSTQLGVTGKEGTVYLVTIDGKEYAKKEFKSSKSILRVKTEADFQKKAADVGVAPNVIEISTQRPPYIIMEKMDCNVLDVIKNQNGELTEDQQKNILSLYKRLDNIGILHNDSNPLNLMYSGKDWKLVDYGFSKKITTKHCTNPNLNITVRFLLKSTKGLLTRKYLKKEPTILLKALDSKDYSIIE